MAERVVVVGVVNGQAMADPDIAHISVRERDEVVWRGLEPFDIDFGPPGAPPFGQAKFSGKLGDRPKSGLPSGGPNRTFKYTLTVHTSGGPVSADPSVETDP